MASYFSLGKRGIDALRSILKIADQKYTVYAISFICTLNTRKVIRGRGTDREGSSGASSGNARNNNTFLLVTPTGNSRILRTDRPSPPDHNKVLLVSLASYKFDSNDVHRAWKLVCTKRCR